MTLKKILPLAALLAVALPGGQAFAAPKPKVQFSQSAFAVAENGGSATITVIRPRNGHSTVRLSKAVSVDYSTSDGTAKAGTDYTATSGTLSFLACPSSFTATDPCVKQTFAVPVIDNSIVDGPRTVNLKLSHAVTSSGTRAILGYPSTATLVIADDDTSPGTGPTFQLATASDLVSEGAPAETVFVIRSGDLSTTSTVNYATADGTALSGTDYTGVSGQLTFPSQATDPTTSIIQSVDVPLLHNPATTPPTADFSFGLSLPGGDNSTLTSPSSETVTIVNVDGTPTLLWSSPSYSVAENGGSVRMTVFAAGAVPASGEVDVDYATADGSAVDGVNYTAQRDTLQFFSGDVAESFDVSVMADGQPNDKFFTAGLANANGGGVIGTPDTATVTVLDTDGAPAGGGSGATGGDTGAGSGGGTAVQGSQLVLGARQSACGLVVKAAKKQKLLKKRVLVLKIRSGQACKVNLAATIKQLTAKKKRRQAQIVRALRFRGKKLSLSLQPNKAVTVKVKFTKKTLKAIKKALRARKRLVATVIVTERAGTSAAKKRTLKITIRR